MTAMTTKQILGAALASLSLMFLSGCATNVNTVERAQPLATPDTVKDYRIVTDNTLADAIRTSNVVQATVSGNLMKIQVSVENRTNSPKSIFYKFEWYDRDGMAVDAPTENWKQLRLQGRETINVSSVAVSPRAVDFKLKLQETQ